MLIRFFCQGDERVYAQQNSMLLLLFLSLSVYLFSYSFCIHYHPPLCIPSHVTTTSYERWLDSVFISPTFTHSKRIFIYIAHITNDVVVNVFFFCIVAVLSLSPLYVDSYLFRFVQERRRNTTSYYSAWINFFILSSMHVCSSSYEYAFFSLHIINFPLLYSIL
jgi:hypothetical protein